MLCSWPFFKNPIQGSELIHNKAERLIPYKGRTNTFGVLKTHILCIDIYICEMEVLYALKAIIVFLCNR